MRREVLSKRALVTLALLVANKTGTILETLDGTPKPRGRYNSCDAVCDCDSGSDGEYSISGEAVGGPLWEADDPVGL